MAPQVYFRAVSLSQGIGHLSYLSFFYPRKQVETCLLPITRLWETCLMTIKNVHILLIPLKEAGFGPGAHFLWGSYMIVKKSCLYK